MDPAHNSQRNNLKRPRLGSLDAEIHRTPPGPPGGAYYDQIGPDVHPTASAEFYASNSSHPTATSHWIDYLPLSAQNHQQLIPSSSQVLPGLEFNLSMSSTGWLDTETHRPPPGPPGGARYDQIGPDARLSAGAQFYTSDSVHPTATNHWIDHSPLGAQNYQQLIPYPSQMLEFNLLMPSTSQTYITGGNNIENHGNLNFYHQTSPAAQDPCLTQLHKHAASNAIHTSSAVDNQGLCMPGTRAFTLQRLQSLVGSGDNSDPDVIWMHGPAGSGKSAIMRTMANALDEQGVLLGSFFFFRSDAQRNTSAPFIPTMTFQSFTSCPATQPHIRNTVHSHPNIFSQSIRHQLHRLFETPLKLAAGHEPKWTPESPLVLVVDGLDECADADRQVEIIKAMLQLASTIRSSTNRRVKILIASRPEKPIQDEFELHDDSVTIIELDPSDANIDLFYDTRLDEIRRRKGLLESWPSLRQIQWLKRKTSGQYSFAHISMGFLAGGDPVERLKMIENGVGTHGLEPFGALDALYATVFRQIPPEMAENALLLVRTWLLGGFHWKHEAHLVERMLSLPSGFSLQLLPYLSSIFHDDDGEYNPYHASLGDFLEDQGRAGKYSLFLGWPALATTIVEGLLGFCIDPLTLPIDKEEVGTWIEGHYTLTVFLEHIAESDILQDFFPLPSTTAILDQLTLLLPTMDLYTFGYCDNLLSTLFKDSLERSRLSSGLLDKDQFTSNPSYFHTVRRLIDQIHSIQHLRFAPYEALEARGDSGLGLFGFLVLFAYHLTFTKDAELGVPSNPPYETVEDMVAHAVRVCVDQDISELERNAQKPLPLCTLALQLAAARKLGHCHLGNFVSAQGLFSGIEDKFQKMSLCLSQTIAMFLDLPLGNTRIQGRISEWIACANHAKLCLQCCSCALNLQRVQGSVIPGVLSFLVSINWDVKCWDVVIDARTFVRCYRFCNVVRGVQDSFIWDDMIAAGANILSKSEVERGTDTSVVNDQVRTIVLRLHESRGMHSRWNDSDDDLQRIRYRYRAARNVPRYDCWVCSGIRYPEPSAPGQIVSSESSESDSI